MLHDTVKGTLSQYFSAIFNKAGLKPWLSIVLIQKMRLKHQDKNSSKILKERIGRNSF